MDRANVAATIDAALLLLPARMDTDEARVMLYATGLQESRFEHRWQVIAGGGKGPARGFWQFERAGGVRGVMTHAASRYWANDLCMARGVDFHEWVVWEALERDDVLAAGFARLLLFTDPHRLPSVLDEQEAWECYLRLWRPGKPRNESWETNHRLARDLVLGAMPTPGQPEAPPAPAPGGVFDRVREWFAGWP